MRVPRPGELRRDDSRLAASKQRKQRPPGWGGLKYSSNATLQATLAPKIYRPLRFQANATGGDNGVCDLLGTTPLPDVNSGPERKAVNDLAGLPRSSVARSAGLMPWSSKRRSSPYLRFQFPCPLDHRPESFPNGLYHFGKVTRCVLDSQAPKELRPAALDDGVAGELIGKRRRNSDRQGRLPATERRGDGLGDDLAAGVE